MDNLEHIRKYYSKFINSTSGVVKSYSGKVIKNIGDCILFYFPKTTDFKDTEVFREIIDCGFKRILLGSTASGVVTYAHCHVLVVR